jgi:hypothetical protein
MWNFIKKIWYDKSDTANPRIPISAENLNRIEDGIQEALDGINAAKDELTKYADGNILYFTGDVAIPEYTWTDVFQLPQDIDFSKYIVLCQGFSNANNGKLHVVPYDIDTTIQVENTRSARIRVSSAGLVSFYSDKSSYSYETVHIILLPVNKRDMTSLI